MAAENAIAISTAFKVLSASSSPSIRGELENVRTCFFWLLIVCTAIVAIGVLLEVAEDWFPLGRPVLDMNTGIFRPHPSIRWRRMAVNLGWKLVMLGVIGEGIFEVATSGADTTLQEFNNTLLAITTDEAGSAAKSAKTAHAEANAVKGIADEARADAKDALAKAQAAQRELAHAEADAVKAQAISSNALSKAAEAESHLAEAMRGVKALEADLERLRTPRHLYHKAKIAPLLKEFSGTEYVFIGTCEDQECFDLVSDIDELLQLAGWKRIKGPPLRIGIAQYKIHGDKDFSVDASVSIGTTISAETPNGFDAIKSLPENQQAEHIRAAIALNQLLASNISPPENTGKRVGVDTGTSTAVRIDVGRKPL